jgi:hypothetical protein
MLTSKCLCAPGEGRAQPRPPRSKHTSAGPTDAVSGLAIAATRTPSSSARSPLTTSWACRKRRRALPMVVRAPVSFPCLATVQCVVELSGAQPGDMPLQTAPEPSSMTTRTTRSPTRRVRMGEAVYDVDSHDLCPPARPGPPARPPARPPRMLRTSGSYAVATRTSILLIHDRSPPACAARACFDYSQTGQCRCATLGVAPYPPVSPLGARRCGASAASARAASLRTSRRASCETRPRFAPVPGGPGRVLSVFQRAAPPRLVCTLAMRRARCSTRGILSIGRRKAKPRIGRRCWTRWRSRGSGHRAALMLHAALAVSID